MRIPKILTLLFCLAEMATISFSQTPTYPTYRVVYYPTNYVAYYPSSPPPPRSGEKPSLAIVVVWRGSLVSELTINAAPGERYSLESSTDLKKWVEIEKVSIGESGQRVVRVLFDHSAPQRFFRLTK